MKKTIIFIFISMLVSLSLKAQIYNRYNLYFTDLYSLNSAAVSTDTMMSATLFTNFANVGFSGSPATVTMMAKGPVDEISGIGLRAFHDSRGAFRTNSFLASYAYKLRFAETGHHLAMGLSAGVYMQNFRIDQIDAIQMDDPNLLHADYANKTLFMNEFSLLYQYNNLMVGFSAPYVAQLYNHYIAHASYYFDLPTMEGFSFSPMLLYQYLPEGKSQVDATARFNYQSAWLALTYRSNNNFLTALGLRYGAYELAYCFEMNSEPFSVISGSTHEIMLRYQFDMDMNLFKSKKPSYDKEKMPWQK